MDNQTACRWKWFHQRHISAAVVVFTRSCLSVRHSMLKWTKVFVLLQVLNLPSLDQDFVLQLLYAAPQHCNVWPTRLYLLQIREISFKVFMTFLSMCLFIL